MCGLARLQFLLFVSHGSDLDAYATLQLLLTGSCRPYLSPMLACSVSSIGVVLLVGRAQYLYTL